MKLDQNILTEFKKADDIKNSHEDKILNLLLKDIISDSRFKYFVSFPTSDYGELEIKFYHPEEENKENNIFSFKVLITKSENIQYNYHFDWRSSVGNEKTKQDFIIIENAFSFINKIINNIELLNKKIILDLYSEYFVLYGTYSKIKNDLQKNKDALEDYENSLIFNKILGVFEKDNKASSDMYNDLIETYYHDTKKTFITIERELGKVHFRPINVEAKHNKKLSLMYKHSRISKSSLKFEIEKDLFLFNGKIIENTEDLVSELGIEDIVSNRYKNGKLPTLRIEVDINKLYNFFKKHIIANEF